MTITNNNTFEGSLEDNGIKDIRTQTLLKLYKHLYKKDYTVTPTTK